LSFNPAATSTFLNSLTSASATILPIIAPLWDDLDGTSTGTASYLTTGTAGNRIFTFEWLNWEWNFNANAAVISFQVKLYEATGKIEFVYRQEAGTVVSGTASIGLAGTTTGNYLSLNGTSATPLANASPALETTTLSAKPATGQVYQFSLPTTTTGFTCLWSPISFFPAGQQIIANPLAIGVTATTTFTPTIIANGCPVNSSNSNVTVSIFPVLSAAASAASASICTGNGTVLTATPTGGRAPFTYSWSNGVTATTPSTSALINISPTVTTVYTVTVIDACGQTAVSPGITVTVNPKPTALINPASNINLCTGATQVYNVATDIGNLYQWKLNAGNISGATANTYTASSSGFYQVVVTNSLTGCKDSSALSNLNINTVPAPVTIIPPSVTFCSTGAPQLLTAGGGLSKGVVSFSSANINLPIPDKSTVGINNALLVTGIPAGSVIDSVIVKVNISHTIASEVEVNLQAPNGQIINLLADRGATSALGFVNTRISSDLFNSSFSSTVPPFTGTFAADRFTQATLIGAPVVTTQTFSNLFSLSNGNWMIRVYDDDSLDIGTLANWSIKIAYTAPADFTWSPNTGLFTDSIATIPYTGGITSTIYAKPTSTTTYTATASAGACINSTSNTATLTVSPLSVIVAALPAAPICPGSSVALTAIVAGGGTPYTYSWSNGQTVVGTTQGINVTPSATSTYTVTITDACLNIATAFVTITVKPNPITTTIPTGIVNICSPATSQLFTANAAVGNSFQWKLNHKNITGANANTYLATVNGIYQVVIANSTTGCKDSSALSFFIINPVPTGVTASTSSASICSGNPVNLFSSSIAAPATILSEDFESGSTGWSFIDSASTGINIPAQIFGIATAPFTGTSTSVSFSNFSISGSKFVMAFPNKGGTLSPQTSTFLLSPSFSTQGFTGTGTLLFKHGYRNSSSFPVEQAIVQITKDGGFTWTNLVNFNGTNAGITTNNAQTTVTYSLVIPAAFIGQPLVQLRWRYITLTGFYWVLDDIVLAATPLPYTYAWSSVPAGFSSTVQNPVGVIPTISTNYTVAVSAASGCASSANTSVITVIPSTIGGTVSSNQTICSGGSLANLTLGGNVGNVLKWQKSTNINFVSASDISNTSNTLSVAAMGTLSDTNYFRAVVQSAACTIANSDVATIIVRPTTIITTQPIGGFICEGTPLNLSVNALGSNLIYQWQKNGAAIPSATSATYTIPIITPADSGVYRVVVSGDCGIITSTNAAISVKLNGIWIGAVNTDWTNASNWECGTIPTVTTNVVINGGLANYPVVNLNVEIKTLKVKPGASITVAPGFNIILNGN
jgi:subtilisin-like proprotein convertase family protein